MGTDAGRGGLAESRGGGGDGVCEREREREDQRRSPAPEKKRKTMLEEKGDGGRTGGELIAMQRGGITAEKDEGG